MTASFLEQMLTIYIHLGMLSTTFVTLTKVRVQLGVSERMKLDSGVCRNDDGRDVERRRVFHSSP